MQGPVRHSIKGMGADDVLARGATGRSMTVIDA